VLVLLRFVVEHGVLVSSYLLSTQLSTEELAQGTFRFVSTVLL
jgi:hypothetical protein